jgi:hypothetical protein
MRFTGFEIIALITRPCKVLRGLKVCYSVSRLLYEVILLILWNLNFRHSFQNRALLDDTLSQPNSNYIPTRHFIRIHFNIVARKYSLLGNNRKKTTKQCPLLGSVFLIRKSTQPLLSNAFANKRVPTTTNPHATREELLGAVFYAWSVLRSYKQDSWSNKSVENIWS